MKNRIRMAPSRAHLHATILVAFALIPRHAGGHKDLLPPLASSTVTGPWVGVASSGSPIVFRLEANPREFVFVIAHPDIAPEVLRAATFHLKNGNLFAIFRPIHPSPEVDDEGPTQVILTGSGRAGSRDDQGVIYAQVKYLVGDETAWSERTVLIKDGHDRYLGQLRALGEAAKRAAKAP